MDVSQLYRAYALNPSELLDPTGATYDDAFCKVYCLFSAAA